MHEHVATYKVDLDILGTANSFLKHSVVSKEVTYDWSSTPRNTMHLVRESVDNEDQGKMVSLTISAEEEQKLTS